MKQPRQGIRSTRTQTGVRAIESTQPSPLMVDIEHEDQQGPPRPQTLFTLSPNVIEDDDMDNMIIDTNLYCFATFADKHTGMIYNDLTGTFPFMLLQGNVCFLVVYHYKSNTILALSISGFSYNVIFRAYKIFYEMIESKGFVIRFNIMDNQAS